MDDFTVMREIGITVLVLVCIMFSLILISNVVT